MILNKIKDKMISAIAKFYEINDGEVEIKIPRSEIELTDGEINSVLENLVKKEMIEVLENKITKDSSPSKLEILGVIRGSDNYGIIKIKVKEGLIKYIRTNEGNSEVDDNEVLFKVTCSKNGELFINNLLIAKPRFNGENDVFVTFIMDNPNRTITVEEFVEFKKSKMTKDFDLILKDLGFVGHSKKLFFPKVSKTAIEFRNPVSKKDMSGANFEHLALSDFSKRKLRNNRKK